MPTTTSNNLRRLDGGVVANFTPLTAEVDLTGGQAIGDLDLGFTVPANRFAVGAFIKNPDGTLYYGSNATLAVKVGTTKVVADTLGTSITSNGVMTIATAPTYSTSAREVYLTVGTAAITAGEIKVGVIYA